MEASRGASCARRGGPPGDRYALPLCPPPPHIPNTVASILLPSIPRRQGGARGGGSSPLLRPFSGGAFAVGRVFFLFVFVVARGRGRFFFLVAGASSGGVGIFLFLLLVVAAAFFFLLLFFRLFFFVRARVGAPPGAGPGL